jgi:hypothetical protein
VLFPSLDFCEKTEELGAEARQIEKLKQLE